MKTFKYLAIGMVLSVMIMAGIVLILVGVSGPQVITVLQREPPQELFIVPAATLEPDVEAGVSTEPLTVAETPLATEIVPITPLYTPTSEAPAATETPSFTETPSPTASPTLTSTTAPTPEPTATSTPPSELEQILGSQEGTAGLPSLEAFATQQAIAAKDRVTGLYIPGVLAAPIVEQPAGNNGYVSPLPNTITRFRVASQVGVLGLLGHNTLAGSAFFKLKNGDVFYVIYGDGSIKPFIVTKILKYQALSPNSPYSDFIDLTTGERLSVTQAFQRTYGQAQGGAVLQTCIARNGIGTWGRIFVVAYPLGS